MKKFLLALRDMILLPTPDIHAAVNNYNEVGPNEPSLELSWMVTKAGDPRWALVLRKQYSNGHTAFILLNEREVGYLHDLSNPPATNE